MYTQLMSVLDANFVSQPTSEVSYNHDTEYNDDNRLNVCVLDKENPMYLLITTFMEPVAIS